MTKLKQKFKPVAKDRLFYNQFNYCLGFYLDEVNCLRVLDHDHIDILIQRRIQWREVAQQRWISGRHTGTIISRRWKDITDKTITDLHDLADIMIKTPAQFKLVVSSNQAHVYTNDLKLVDRLDLLEMLFRKTYSVAHITRPKNTIALKKSKYQYRSYFKFHSVTLEQKSNLIKFFKNQQDYMRLSPGLQSWLEQTSSRVQDYFFIDHDSETWLSMLSLIHPGLVRKTMKIITDK